MDDRIGLDPEALKPQVFNVIVIIGFPQKGKLSHSVVIVKCITSFLDVFSYIQPNYVIGPKVDNQCILNG